MTKKYIYLPIIADRIEICGECFTEIRKGESCYFSFTVIFCEKCHKKFLKEGRS